MIQSLKRLSYDKVIILLIAFTSVWVSSNLNWNDKRAQTIIKADGKGYFAHLQAVFIFNDLNFGFFDKLEADKYYNKHLYYDYRKELNGKYYNKYFCGTAIPMTPFFLIAHGITKVQGGLADGHGKWYHILINIAAIFYLVVALIYFGKLMGRFGISNLNKGLTYLVIYFGTNWFYWVNVEPAVSHVYTVALIPMFFHFYLQFNQRKKPGILLIAFLLLGLIILIRPLNVLCVLALPLFFPSFREFRQSVVSIISKPSWLLIALFSTCAVVSLQFILYQLQLGQFWIYSYEKEGFHFLKPEVYHFLLSYKKGLFVYTPVLLASVAGFYFWFKKNKWQSSMAGLFLTVIVYILASWHMWWYGGGFGTRVMIDYYVIWAIPLAILLQSVKGMSRKFTVSILTLLVLFCQFQTFQYRYVLIHWDGPTKSEYWDVFLKPWF